jgi:hypothetical protein
MKTNRYLNILVIVVSTIFIYTFFDRSNAVFFDYYYQVPETLFLLFFYLILTRFENIIKKIIYMNPLFINKTSKDLEKISNDLWNIVRFLILGLALVSLINTYNALM